MIRKFKSVLLLGLFAALLALNSQSSSAQIKEGQSLDKIVAEVGNEMIMKSDVDAYLAALKQQDPTLSPEDEGLKKKILDMLIDEKLIIMKAIEDSIVVTDEEIEQRMDYQLQAYVNQLGSMKRLEDVFKMSEAQIRYKFRDDIRKRLLAERMQAKHIGNTTVSPREVKEFYVEFSDSLPTIPAQVELCHIVKEVKAKTQTKIDVKELAMRVRDSLLNGGDFAEFATRYSGDTYSAKHGGDLGWVKKGKFYAEFEKAAYALQKGQISMPVETPFGFHIIQTIDKKAEEINTRHILFKIEQSMKDREEVVNLLNKMRDSILAGVMTFEEMAKKFSDEKETKGFGGELKKMNNSTKFYVPLNAREMAPFPFYPANLNDIINNLKVGGISEPLIYKSQPKLSFRIILKKSYSESHEANLEEDYDEIEQFALQNKQNKLREKWLAELRKEMYWEIKK